MIISKEFYDKCGPSYQKVIDELEKKLADIEKCDAATKGEKVILAIYHFSKQHLTPPEYWQHCLDYIGSYICHHTLDYMYHVHDRFKKLRRDVITHAYYHLYLNKKWSWRFYWGSNYLKLDYFHRRIINGFMITIYERELCYPHDELKLCLREFEQQTSKLPSKDLYKRCEEMMALYPKIQAAVGDIDEWFQLLLKVNDDKYLKDNIEYRIGHDLHNVKLWKIYMKYLKQNGQFKYLLGIYSKYCRFFLDDDDMKKEYQKAMLEHGPVNLPWKNLLEFEKGCDMEEIEDQYFTPEEKEEDDTQSSDDEDSESSDEEDLLTFDKSICRRFYVTYKADQEFALPLPIIRYVLKNSGHQVLRKLFASCKYFFKKQPTPICYRLRTGPREIYEGESLTLKEYSKKESFPKNIYITGNIFCEKPYAPSINFLPKFYRCEAKFISLPSGIHLSFDELKSLIGHGGVVELNICILKDENKEDVAFEKIMACLPNIEKLQLYNVKMTEETPHALTSMKFNSKFDGIDIGLISGEPFDDVEFLKFLIINKFNEPYQSFDCRFTFCKEFDADFVQKLEKLMKDYSAPDDYCHVEVDVNDNEEDEEEDDVLLETDSNDSD